MNTHLSIFTSLLLTACNSPAAKPDIRSLCTDTVNAYAHARDAGDTERASALFTEDATVTIFGQVQDGREAVLAALKARAEGTVSRHLISSVLITPTSASTAIGESYVLVIAGEDKGLRPLGLSDNNLLAAGTYEDSFRIEYGTCRVASRNVIVDFQKQ